MTFDFSACQLFSFPISFSRHVAIPLKVSAQDLVPRRPLGRYRDWRRQLSVQIPDLEIYWVVFSAPGPRAEEAKQSAEDFLHTFASKVIKIGSFRESPIRHGSSMIPWLDSTARSRPATRSLARPHTISRHGRMAVRSSIPLWLQAPRRHTLQAILDRRRPRGL